MIAKVRSIYKAHREFILYSLIGIEGIAVELATFWVVLHPLGQDKLVANFFSMLTSITHNFILNAYFNFKTKDKLIARFVSYFLIALIGLAISSTIILIGTDVFGIDPLVSKVVSIVIVVFTQFFLNEKITFKGYKQPNA